MHSAFRVTTNKIFIIENHFSTSVIYLLALEFSHTHTHTQKSYGAVTWELAYIVDTAMSIIQLSIIKLPIWPAYLTLCVLMLSNFYC